MKWLIRIAIAVVALVVVVVVAAFAAVNMMDWKPRVAAAAKEATGREVKIDGDLDIGLSLGLQLDVTANGVHLANAAGAKPADMVALGALSLRVQLLPLLTSRAIVIDSLIVREPVINLAVDAKGRPNWVFKGKPGAEAAHRPARGEGPPFASLRIGQLSIEKGAFSYADAVSGQRVQASDINLKFALTDLDSPLSVDGGMVLNKEPVTLKLDIDTPNRLLNGPDAKTTLALASKYVKVSYQGRVLRQPVTGLDGVFDADVPSVGGLAAWLDRPLAKGQPDPGPLKLHAVFAGEGAKVTLKEARLEGKSLNATASGSFDGSGDVARLTLSVESGVLDIDRYLPPAKPAQAEGGGGGGLPAGNPLARLSDAPIDLSALRRTDADVKLAIEGLKVAGFRLGRIGFTARAKAGVLTAELARLALYGGGISGKVALDAKSDVLDLNSEVTVDKVKVEELAQAATGEKSIVGIASGTLRANSKGKSPRELAQNLQGKLAFSLGDVKNAPGGAISGLDVDIDLPGMEKQPTLAANVVYNKQKVALAVRIDPLRKVLESDRFDVDLKLTSDPVSLSYAGAVQHRPVPGLDGGFALDVPSVAALAAWLGQPLAKGQPDPGPLKVSAKMATEGDSFLVKEATITGKALKAKASGSYKAERPVPRFDARIDVEEANLNAYLPPEQKKAKAKPAAAGPAGWSREPIDFSGLKAANGKAVMNLAKVLYKNLEITKGRITTTLEGGVLDSKVDSLQLAGGTIGATAQVDASAGEAAKIAYTASVKDVEARPLLSAFAGTDRLSGKTEVEAEGQTRGASEYDLVRGLNGKGSIKFLNGAIHGINLAATLRKAGSLGLSSKAGEAQQTDFAELGGTYTITNGVIDNRDLKMLAPLVRVTGAGQVPMPPQTVDYTAEAKLVASLKGQGGKDALAGVPIPIHITGTWQNPKWEVDWNAVFKSLAADPANLANLPGALADKAKDLGIALPGGSGGSPTDVLKGLLPGSGGTTEKSGDTGGSGTSNPVQKPLDALKGLFK